jgi:hypothetical protein
MFFEDESRKRKVNMGNISLTNKNDFMKKMREEEERERSQKQQDRSMQIIKQFMNKNFASSSNDFQNSKMIHNFHCVLCTRNNLRILMLNCSQTCFCSFR